MCSPSGQQYYTPRAFVLSKVKCVFVKSRSALACEVTEMAERISVASGVLMGYGRRWRQQVPRIGWYCF